MKPLFRPVIVPRKEFSTQMGYELHVAEERARVARNQRVAVSAIVGAIVSLVLVRLFR